MRRQWLKDPKLGIKVVHIDPYYNATAQFLPGKWFAPKPTTSVAMAMAIAYVWIKEGLYDKEYVETHTVGFDKWKDYLLGDEDGIPKTPEWQEKETGVPAKDVRALAREWGKKRVYLAPGGWGNGHGGACRNQTGIQWARVMVCLSAMQGLGKPGCNMGNLQWGCPLDFNFYFPGYSEGGMSGDLENTAMPVELYQRMPQLPTMNSNGADDPAHLDAGGDHRGQGGRLSLGRQVDRAPVRQVHVSVGRPFAGAHALQVRRLDPLDDEQHQPLGEDVPVVEPRIRRQPVDLVRGRGEVRRRHPAGLHQFRAHRHLRMGRPRRLRPPRPAAAQSPRHRVPGAGDRAAGRIEVRLLDLQRDLQAARPRQLLLGRLQRARLGQAHLSRLRPAEGDLVQEAAQARLLRRAGREGEAARAGVVPLVLGEPQEGRAGGAAAAVGLHRGISARPADAVRQARVRVQQPQARQRSGAPADRQIRAGRGRRRTRRTSSAIRCRC